MSINRKVQGSQPESQTETRGVTSRPQKPGIEGAVLVVDDNPVIRQIFRRALELAQFKVAEAESGTRALTMLEHGRPALIVLDLMMQGMDGFKFLTQLRLRPEWRSIPAVVLSAKPLSADEQKFVSENAQHFQPKGKSAGDDVVRLAKQFLPQSDG